MATLGHILDGNTLALWRCDEATAGAAFVDATGIYNVPVTAGSFATVAGQIGGARTFGTGNTANTSNITDNVILPVLQSGTFTWEGWFWLDPADVTDFNGRNGTIACYSGSISAFVVGFASGGQLRYSNPTSGAVVAGNWSNLTRSAWHHYAVRSTSSDATHATIEFFIDGVKTATVANTLKMVGAMATQQWFIGQENSDFFIGRVDDSRFSKIARTDAEIADSFWRGLLDRQSPQFAVPPLQVTGNQDFQNYQQALSPTALVDPTGTLFESAFGSMKDVFADRLRLSLKSRLPQNAPPDALTQIGTERGMPQGQTESGTAYATRLQDAWNAWPWAGTPFGLLRAFYATGYTNVVLAQVRGGKQFTLDNGATNLLLWSNDLGNAPWVLSASGTGSNPTVTRNFAVAPDGTTTATRVQLNQGAGTTVNDYSAISQAFTGVNGATYTVSVWLKTNDGTNKTILIRGVRNENGQLLNVTGTWQRFSYTTTADGSPNGTWLWIRGTAGTSAPTVDLLVSGIQLEAANAAGPYSQTFASAKTTALTAGSLLTSTMASGIWETDPLTSYSPVNQGFWSKFDVVFPLPLMPPNWGWSAGIPASNSNESNFIRALIKAWAPAHASCDRIIIVQQGNVWGYPATQLWGASTGLWGGSANILWTP